MGDKWEYKGTIPVTRIIKNSIRCKHCDTVIESVYCHDFVACACGKVAADGGKDYLKRTFPTSPEDDYEELSIYEHNKLA